MKININDPSMKAFVTTNSDAVNLVNPGKALTAVGTMVTEATGDMIVRRNIMTNKTSSLDINSFNEYNSHYNSVRQDIAPNIFSSILGGISSIKNSSQPIPLS
jgi:hypothetical protein